MGISIMAGLTFREAARKKLLWIAILAGVAFLTLYGVGLHYNLKSLTAHKVNAAIRGQIWSAMLMMGFYAVDLLTVVMTVVTSVDTLSGEIASGTIHAVATKPINRWQVLIGKWLGFAGMLTAYLALMVGGVALVMYLQTGYKAQHLLRGFALIWLETLLLLTLTFLFGTSFSTLTNGVLALGLHGLAFLGGWIEQFGSLANSQRAVDVGIVASILMPSEVLWRRAAFEMQSPLANAFNISPFSAGAVPSVAMIVYAGIYVATSLGLALWLFGKRDL